MKIEVKKNKYNVNKNQRKAPENAVAAETAPAAAPAQASVRKPKFTFPKIRIPRIQLPGISLPKIRLPKLSFPKLSLPEFKGKGVLRIIIMAAAIPALAVILWLGLNLWRHSIPSPLFTQSSLPPVQPAENNGCADIYSNELYNEYFQKDLCDINIFRNAAAIENFLDKSREEYAFAKKFIQRDDVKKMLGLYRDITAKPQFADMVMPDARDSQKVRVFVALLNSMTGAIITGMQEKKYGAVFSLMKNMLNLNILYLKSARSMTNYITAMYTYEKSLNILKSILTRFVTVERKGKEAVASCREIGGLAQSFNPQSIPLGPIVMFEYILSWKQAFDPALVHPEAATYQGMKYKKLVFFNRGLTQRLFDEKWKKIYECAMNPNDAAMTELNIIQQKRHASGRFWWFQNAVGKQYLDTIAISGYQVVPESKRWTTVLGQKHGEIIAIINSIKEDTKPEKKTAKKKKPGA